MTEVADFTFKILIIGESSVGKTAIMERYCEDKFHDELITTIGVDFNSKIERVNNSTVKLQLWDTAGQERFRNVTSSYYKGTQGCLVVYDVTNREYTSEMLSLPSNPSISNEYVSKYLQTVPCQPLTKYNQSI